MASSQFTIYKSTDGSAPVLTGAASSLITLMDAVLVNGYGSKAAAGWTKPVANSGNIGCYKNSTGGTGFGLVVNDNGANVTSTFKEAWFTGWESVATVGSPVGTGSGQFPTAAQSLTSGHLVVRKSTTADATARAWVAAADAYTFYLWILSGDTANVYFSGMFGDIFSMAGATDAYRCMVSARSVENSGAASLVSDWDTCGNLGVTSSVGMYMPRVFGGGGSSIITSRMGDPGKISLASATSNSALAGNVQTPNGPDGSLYLSPLWVYEISSLAIRGRMRGLYHLCHPIASFADGQTLNGANDYAGKTFQIILKGPNSGMVCLETSATVETN